MNIWDYRVVRKKLPNGEVVFGIHEVYYDKHKNPQYCSNGPMEPTGESIRELRAELARMLKALEKPILKHEDF